MDDENINNNEELNNEETNQQSASDSSSGGEYVVVDPSPTVVLGGYLDTYYGWNYGEVSTVKPGGNPGGDYATDEEVKEAIAAALDSINLVRLDDDSFALQVGNRTSDPIDDVYVTGVERDDSDGKQVVKFLRSNGKGSIDVNLDEFEDPNIDASTF